MKSLVFLFAIIIMAGCEYNTINYYYNNDGEWIKCPDNDCEGILRPDDSVVVVENDQETKDDMTIPDSDQDESLENDPDSDTAEESEAAEEDTDLFIEPDTDSVVPDEDSFVDYCANIVDLDGTSLAGDYSDAKNGNPATILTIVLESQDEKNNCLITFFSSSIPEVNNLSVEATKMPIKNMLVSHNGKEYYFFASFLSGSNYLRLELYDKNTLDTVLDQQLKRK